MITEKLYYKDSYISDFTATVIDCNKANKGYAVVLDKTAFFPEGGGQAADNGTIDGANVFDVQIADDIITHFTEKAIEIGTQVVGKVNFKRRFAFMQNHTGEHIVSGLTHKLYGLNNVGFHLGEDFVTVDFDGELTAEQLSEIEYEANCRIWQNLFVNAFCPTKEQLCNIDYRSKKEIDGQLRIVEIEGTDICACCAPHVNRTGEIGVIKLLDTERMRGGVRIIVKCGSFALDDYRVKYENISKISNLLSSKQEDAAAAVFALEDKLNEEKQYNVGLKKRFADYVVKSAGFDENCLFVEDCDIKDLQLIADKLHKTYGGVRGVFSGSGEEYSFAVCGDDTLDDLFKKFRSQLNVRGGGRNGMVQGTVFETADKIKLFF